ncbi:MAG: CoA ester lyase [Steroidobacteraceae bacterium]
MTQELLRSVLYVPASNDKALLKATQLAADAVIVDLEDAVSPDGKAEARARAAAAIADRDWGDRFVVLRVNALSSEWGEADVSAALEASPAAILLPKVSKAQDLHALGSLLAVARRPIAIWAMIETCEAILNLADIVRASASLPLRSLVIGTNDLAKQMRIRLGPGRQPLQPVFTQIVIAARAQGLAVLDGVCNDLQNLERFREECLQARAFGMDGKTLIHPAQIPLSNDIFGPQPEEVAWASAVVDAFEHPDNIGKGVIRIQGEMVELLHLQQARAILTVAQRAKAAG